MASQLREVLSRFETYRMPVSVAQMAQEMQLEPGVLYSMIDYWVRKGKLREVNSHQQTCHTCGIKTGCPFIVALPRYFERVTEMTSHSEPPCACRSDQC
jgi:hypothetical protein